MITGIIMASGFSRRMQDNKLTLSIDGASILERVIRAVVDSNIHEVVLVYREDNIRKIAESYGVRAVFNPHAYKGQSTSIKVGIGVSRSDTEGYGFFVGDQPFISTDIVNQLIRTFEDNKSKIVVPLYKGKQGNPAIFPSVLRDKLLRLEGDVGGRKILGENPELITYVNIDEELPGRDVDTWEEYIKVKKTKE